MRKSILALAALCLTVGLTACSGGNAETTAATTAGSGTTAAGSEAAAGAETSTGAETEAKETSGGTLTMATNAEFPPYEFHEGGKIVGIDAEIAAAIADKLGMELKIEDMAFDSIIPAVVSGKADFGAAGMTVLPERLQSVDFTDTYAEAAQVIIVKEGSAIVGKDDLNGKKIGVQLGTTGDIYAGDIPDAAVERYNKGMEAVQALSQNKIDAVVIDREPAKVFVKENEGLKILDEAYTVEQYALAVKKGNTELTEKINGAIKELQESGELQKIVDKYITAE